MKAIDILLLNGISTKSQAKKLLQQGCVQWNGQTLYSNKEIDAGQFTCDQKALDIHPLKYLIINKPKGCLCANRDLKEPCLIDLLPYKDLHYVGRLDRDTTGLMIMTNDKKLRKKLTLPDYEVPKIYEFLSKEPVSAENIQRLKEGIMIDRTVKCKSAICKMKDEKQGTIMITEGRYHEIKKMFLSLDNHIVSLKRIAFGKITLGDLKEGSYRFLSGKEIIDLYESVGEICNQES